MRAEIKTMVECKNTNYCITMSLLTCILALSAPQRGRLIRLHALSKNKWPRQCLRRRVSRVSLDDSGQRGRGDGGRIGLGQDQDVGSAAGLRSRADQTAAAGSGRAIHQKQHVAGQQAGGDVGSTEEAHTHTQAQGNS